jgi:hypothetical protein
MKYQTKPVAGLWLAMLIALGSATAWAEPPGRPDGPRGEPPRLDNPRDQGRPGPGDAHRDGPRPDTPHWSPPKFNPDDRLDSRYRHDRYYPPRGRFVDRLPNHPIDVPFRDSHYYFQGGVWYRPDGPRFLVVAPPIGLGVSILPPYYTTLWVGGVPYYYADDVYYTWHPDRREYVVVDPPRETDTYLPPPAPEQLFVYPKQGQDEQRMAKDRYECHRWAVEQSGFDPIQPAADLPATQLPVRRADYLRATKACLEARDYSVR